MLGPTGPLEGELELPLLASSIFSFCSLLYSLIFLIWYLLIQIGMLYISECINPPPPWYTRSCI